MSGAGWAPPRRSCPTAISGDKAPGVSGGLPGPRRASGRPTPQPGHYPPSPAQILNAAWNYLFWCRRRWVKAHPGKVWLSEFCLHLIRLAFRALLERFAVPKEAWPEIREEAKDPWPHQLKARLAELVDRERRAIERLHQLQMADLLTAHKLRRALEFLDDLADDMALAQRRLDEAIIKLARSNGYDEAYWGAPLEQCYLSQLDLLELQEEMRQVVAEEEQPSPGEPPSGTPIFQHPAQPGHIQLIQAD